MAENDTRQKGKIRQFFKNFWQRHPILSNVIIMIVAIPVMVYIGLIFVDLWTHHGAKTVVPNVKGLTYAEATDVLGEADLETVISDSIFDLSKRPGQVVDVYPKPGAVVKPGREVYLTIVSFTPQQFVVDVPLTDISSKQAMSYLNSHGIRAIRIVTVPGEFNDLVMQIKADGKPIKFGDKIPVTASVELIVSRTEYPVYANTNDLVEDIINDSTETATETVTEEEPAGEPDETHSMFD